MRIGEPARGQGHIPGRPPTAGVPSGNDGPPPVRPRRRSAAQFSIRLIWLGTAAFTALFLAFVGWTAYRSHAQTIRAAHDSIGNIVLLLEEHTTRTVNAVDMVLQTLLSEQQVGSPARATDFETLVTGLLFRTPHVDKVRILNATTGEVLAAHKAARELVDEIDWEALHAHSAAPASGLHIGEPKRSPDDQSWRVGISRRQVSPDGRALIAVAHISLGDLQRAFDEVNMGPSGSIVLFRSDAMVLARKPYSEANVGKYFPHSALFAEQLKAPRGIYETSAASDGVRRILAYRTVPDAPLVLVAGLSRKDVLAPWRSETLSSLVLLPIAVAFLLTFGVLLSNEAKRRDQAEAQTREKTALLEATLDNMEQGLLMVDADLRVQVCNSRAMELLDLPPDLMSNRPHFNDVTYRQFQTGEFQNSEEAFRQWVAAGGFERSHHMYERERPNGTVLEVRTVPIAGGGAVRTFTDITARRRVWSELRAAEAEYRALFENAVIGVYRSSPDGKQLRANPALVRLNGYASEEEMLAQVNDIGREWYVDPNRRDEFVRLMREHGRVTDFVSEIYRHGTGERIWISETAWTVLGPDGELAYFEGTVLDATDRKRAEAQIEHAAQHDALTELPNRKLLLRQIEARFSDVDWEERPFALLGIDLDMFKSVNDTLGHPVGDALLVAVADRMRRNLRKDDMVARLGGDEFAVLQISMEQPNGAGALAKRLVDALSQPFDIEGHRVNIGASIGIAIAPDDGSNPDQLLRNADLALYKAKSAGRGQFRFFEPAMDAQLQARRSLERDLRGALQNNQLELHYQPFINVATGAIVGFEALLRWRHPLRGSVSPAQFLMLTEETGLVVPIGEWALRQACRDAASWPRDMRVSINLSAAQLLSPGMATTVLSALAASGLVANRLELEITETALMRNAGAVLETLGQLRNLGARVVMDKFGTGFSSLTHLRSFPFDKIKIDCSTADTLGGSPDGDEVVRAVLNLGATLGIDTAAECIEKQAQLDFIRREGCVEAQGFLFGHAQPSREVLRLLRLEDAHAAA